MVSRSMIRGVHPDRYSLSAIVAFFAHCFIHASFGCGVNPPRFSRLAGPNLLREKKALCAATFLFYAEAIG